MKMRRFGIVAVGVAAITTITFLGCVPEKKKAKITHETMEQNALEAEQAEMEMAQETGHEKAAPSHEAHGPRPKKEGAKVETKTAKKHEHETAKVEKVAKTSNRAPASFVGGYVVQVGAFRVKENAEKMHARLQHDGYKTVFRSINHSKNGELYLVHLEPTKDRSEAEAWASKLKTQSIDTQILRK